MSLRDLLNPSIDWPGQVAEDELDRLYQRSQTPFLYVEIDGEERRKVAPGYAGRHGRADYFGVFCAQTIAAARTWTLAVRAWQTITLPSGERLRGVGGSKRWGKWHFATWAAVHMEGYSWPEFWRHLEDSLVRVEDYRLILPSMRPTEDELLHRLQLATLRPRIVPMPRRPKTPKSKHYLRAERIRTFGANDGIYRPTEELLEELNFEDVDE